MSATYDDTGAYDFQDIFQQSIDDFQHLTATAGEHAAWQCEDGQTKLT